MTSTELNVSLALRHTGLMSSHNLLTQEGLQLLQLGKVYGPEASAFMDALARRVLVDGHHLELIYWIYDAQRAMKKIPATGAKHYAALDRALIKAGVISPPAGKAKPAYLRDEPKLWNALGLLERRTKTSYFWPGKGLVFNWRRITAVVSSD